MMVLKTFDVQSSVNNLFFNLLSFAFFSTPSINFTFLTSSVYKLMSNENGEREMWQVYKTRLDDIDGERRSFKRK